MTFGSIVVFIPSGSTVHQHLKSALAFETSERSRLPNATVFKLPARPPEIISWFRESVRCQNFWTIKRTRTQEAEGLASRTSQPSPLSISA
jgi:hypothetical protein